MAQLLKGRARMHLTSVWSPKRQFPSSQFCCWWLVGVSVLRCLRGFWGVFFLFFFWLFCHSTIPFFLYKPTSSRYFHKNLKGKKNSLWTFTFKCFQTLLTQWNLIAMFGIKIYNHKCYNLRRELKEKRISTTFQGSSLELNSEHANVLQTFPEDWGQSWYFWASHHSAQWLLTLAEPPWRRSAERGKPNERGNLQLIKNKWKQKSSPRGLLLISVVIHSQHVGPTWGLHQMEKVEGCAGETAECSSGPSNHSFKSSHSTSSGDRAAF